MNEMKLRPDPTTVEWLQLISDSPEMGASYVLEGAPALWRSLLSDAADRLQLTEPEAKAILDACNGLQLTGPMAGAHLELELRDAVRLNGLDEKWGVDPDFLDRVHVLNRGERWAVEVWASAFWVGGDPDRYPGGRYNDADFERDHLALVVRAEERPPPGKVGQPPRAGETSSARLVVRMTEAEHQRIHELAEGAGLKASEYVRRKLL